MGILKSIVVMFCSPLVVVGLLLLAGYLFRVAGRARRARVFFAIGVGVLFCCSQTFFSDLLLFPLEHLHRADPNMENAAGLIYPLACFYNGRGDVPEISRWAECSLQRLIAAAQVYRQYGGWVLVTGAKNRFHPDASYAEKAKSLLISLGVKAEDIIPVEEGGSTAAEIRAARPYFKGQPTLIISSATHIRRISMLVGSAPNVSYYPVDFVSLGDLKPRIELPSAWALEASGRAFYEYAAIAKDYLLMLASGERRQ